MINNYWEEMDMNDEVGNYHEKTLREKFFPTCPSWLNFHCPFCKELLPRRSLRTIGIKLNTRNMGDLVVEFCCNSCKKMDTLYYRRQITELADIGKFLLGEKDPDIQPILEEDMYKMRYNNLVEQMISDRS